MSVGDFPESLTQALLVGTMLVGRLGVEPFTFTLVYIHQFNLVRISTNNCPLTFISLIWCIPIAYVYVKKYPIMRRRSPRKTHARTHDTHVVP